MKVQQFKKIKEEYLQTPIPKELYFMVKKTLKESEEDISGKSTKLPRLKLAAFTAVASLALLVAGVNTSAALAQSMSKLPVVGNLVQVMTFREYSFDEDTFKAQIKTPGLIGLEDKGLADNLNSKYLQENEELYAQFIAEMDEMKSQGGGHLGVASGYVVKTDNEQILAVGRYVENIVGSSSTVFKYDTIDKKQEILLTLPSLFKNDNYVEIISENIKEQMIAANKADEEQVYWVQGIVDEDFMDFFERIETNQSFYINPDYQLVISFDKYEVAPGYMGVSEFIIPTEILTDILVSHVYIK